MLEFKLAPGCFLAMKFKISVTNLSMQGKVKCGNIVEYRNWAHFAKNIELNADLKPGLIEKICLFCRIKPIFIYLCKSKWSSLILLLCAQPKCFINCKIRTIRGSKVWSWFGLVTSLVSKIQEQIFPILFLFFIENKNLNKNCRFKKHSFIFI